MRVLLVLVGCTGSEPMSLAHCARRHPAAGAAPACADALGVAGRTATWEGAKVLLST